MCGRPLVLAKSLPGLPHTPSDVAADRVQDPLSPVMAEQVPEDRVELRRQQPGSAPTRPRPEPQLGPRVFDPDDLQLRTHPAVGHGSSERVNQRRRVESAGGGRHVDQVRDNRDESGQVGRSPLELELPPWHPPGRRVQLDSEILDQRLAGNRGERAQDPPKARSRLPVGRWAYADVPCDELDEHPLYPGRTTIDGDRASGPPRDLAAPQNDCALGRCRDGGEVTIRPSLLLEGADPSQGGARSQRAPPVQFFEHRPPLSVRAPESRAVLARPEPPESVSQGRGRRLGSR